MSSDRLAASYWVKAAPTSCCAVSTANSTRRSAARVAAVAAATLPSLRFLTGRTVERQGRERHSSRQCERSIGRHPSKQRQLERGDLDPALGELPARVQSIHFHELQALVERRCSSLTYPRPYHLERVPVHAQE